ncbi:hypothetical protein ABBQ32_013082 [Trebouxia sp. C0010 RCD-2024]
MLHSRASGSTASIPLKSDKTWSRNYREVRRCVVAAHSHAAKHPKVAVFVEPSPFSHVSGMKIRFSNLIKELRHLGSEVTVFTPCVAPPKSFCGAKLELGRNRCRDKRMEVWPRAVDTTLFNPAFRCESMRQRMTDGHPDATILVYVGRLGAEKNLEVLRDFLPKLPAHTRLCFVGGGPHRAQLQRHFQGCGVTFMGMLKGEELSAAYASADIFMMPSETETLGFVALEAMASGLPVVAVAAGGLTDIITRPGITSFLYSPGDYEQAIQQTHQLITEPDFRHSMAAAARAEVERLGWSAAISRVRNLHYQRAICIYKAHRRFGTLALRVRTARFFQAGFAVVLMLLGWAVNQLDYARNFRSNGDDAQGHPQLQTVQ